MMNRFQNFLKSILAKSWIYSGGNVKSKIPKSLTIKKKYLVDENNVWLFKYNGIEIIYGGDGGNAAGSEELNNIYINSSFLHLNYK